MTNNGRHSVNDDDRPESGEEILTLSYVGAFPAPEDLFCSPRDLAYCVCTYFYPGVQDSDEVPGDPLTGRPTTFTPVVFEEEGFYYRDSCGPRNAMVWRRLVEIRKRLAGSGLLETPRLSWNTRQRHSRLATCDLQLSTAKSLL